MKKLFQRDKGNAVLNGLPVEDADIQLIQLLQKAVLTQKQKLLQIVRQVMFPFLLASQSILIGPQIMTIFWKKGFVTLTEIRM